MNPRKSIVATSAVLVLLVVLAGGAVGDEAPSVESVRLLIIDGTHSIQSSLQIGQFARALRETGLFDMHAMTEIPVDGNSSGPAYDLAMIVPERPNQVWIVTADLPQTLSPSVRAAFEALKGIASRVYEGADALDSRTVVDVTEDLFPAIYGGLLAQNGWLRLAPDASNSSLNGGGS